MVYQKTLLILLLAFCASCGEYNPAAEKRLYLTSAAINVMDELVPLLPFEPNGRVACYITTASRNADWVMYEINAVKEAGFEVKTVDLAELSKDTIEDPFQNCDIIFVGGGNTFYLLQEVRRSGFDVFVAKKIMEGVPYVGTSAGAVLLAPSIESVKFADDPAEAPDLTSYEGLNLFPLELFVHFDHPDFKASYERILIYALSNDLAFVTVKENQFIYVEGDRWRVIESKRE